MSWDESFSNRYDEWSADMTEDVGFYVELAREANGPLVELAIGNGRVAIPVAQATGRRVIGVDTSPSMLEQARVRAAEAGVDLDLREGDMRELALDELSMPLRAGATQHQLRGKIVPRPTSEAIRRRRGRCLFSRQGVGVVDETLAQEESPVGPQPQRRLDFRAVAARELARVDAG